MSKEKILIRAMLDILDIAYGEEWDSDEVRVDEIAYSAEMCLSEVNHRKPAPWSHRRIK